MVAGQSEEASCRVSLGAEVGLGIGVGSAGGIKVMPRDVSGVALGLCGPAGPATVSWECLEEPEGGGNEGCWVWTGMRGHRRVGVHKASLAAEV